MRAHSAPIPAILSIPFKSSLILFNHPRLNSQLTLTHSATPSLTLLRNFTRELLVPGSTLITYPHQATRTCSARYPPGLVRSVAKLDARDTTRHYRLKTRCYKARAFTQAPPPPSHSRSRHPQCTRERPRAITQHRLHTS